MIIPYKISSAEMREAFRMNLTASFWWKMVLGNARAVVYLVIAVVIILGKLMAGGPMHLATVATLVGVAALLAAVPLFRLYRVIEKNAKALNASCKMLTIDSQGLTSETQNGTRTFVPWSALRRWREGKLVFTIGDAKAFRAVSKGSLGEMQSGELRSLLLSQIQLQH